MTFRYTLAKQSGRFVRWTLKRLNRSATSLPGKVALAIDPKFFQSLTKNMKVVMVTGTNGKTLTTSLITHALSEKYSVLTNESGSNMVQGIATTFLNAKNQEIAVLEVDEANLQKLTPYIKPELIVLTNLFEDQTDRFKNITETYKYIVKGAHISPTSKIIANGDVPLFNHDDLTNPKEFYGFKTNQETPTQTTPTSDDTKCPKCGHPLHYHSLTYANLGDYYCTNCGFAHPQLTYQLTEVTTKARNSISFVVDDFEFTIQVGGLYNIYNALTAVSVAKHFGLTNQQIQSGFDKTPMKFGRQESFFLDDKEIIINLVKNTVGFNQIVDLIELDSNSKSLIALFNNNAADGTDISWINDADFEKLVTLNIEEVLVSGLVAQEVKSRFEATKFTNIKQCDSFQDVIKQLNTFQNNRIYVLATYTALLEFRNLLSNAGYVSKDMK